MEKYKIDIPVFMIFFNRPDTFNEVFESVRKAKPSKLFLVCDGPRNGREDDIQNIKKCQQIASNIDWECEVYRNYSEENLGCGMRMYSGITWAFEYVDRLIILEDDCVPSQGFFDFCYELLERYKDDQRIYMISAMNHLGVYEKTPYDYFFAGGCCWGWATWKRAWKNVEFNMEFWDDNYSMQCVEHLLPYYSDAIAQGMQRKKALERGERLTSWTYQSGMAAALNSQMSIVPKYNMIKNVGFLSGANTSHNEKTIIRKSRAYYNAKTYDMDYPIKHPQYIIEDRMYYKEVQKKFKMNFFDVLEGIFRKLIYARKGDFKSYIKKALKKIINC